MADAKTFEVKIPRKIYEVHKVFASDAEQAKNLVLSGESTDAYLHPEHTAEDPNTWIISPL